MSQEIRRRISELENSIISNVAALEQLKEQHHEYKKETQSKFIEQEHRLLRSAIQFFKSFFINRNDTNKAASASALLSNIWRSSRTGLIITGGGLVGIVTVVLMHNANEIVKKQNYHLRAQNYQFYVANKEDISINVFEKLYETTLTTDDNNDVVAYPKFSEESRENAFRAFINIRNEVVTKPKEERKLGLLESILSAFKNNGVSESGPHKTKSTSTRVKLPFSGVYLNNADLRDLDLSNFILNLDNSNLDNAYLGGLNLSMVSLTSASLVGASLPLTNLEKASLNNAVFTGAHMPGANMQGATCIQCDFHKTRMNNAEISYMQILQSDLRNITLRESRGKHSSFDLSSLEGADLSKSDLSDASFINTNLKNVNFSGASLAAINLTGADIAGADFKDVTGLTCDALSNSINKHKALNIPIDC